MTKTAFLFAGQGAQYLGMGRDLYDRYPIVKETIDQASQVLGYDLRDLIDKEETKLNQTRYTQPAILATSVAIYRLLKEKGYQPDMVAGLSLGEYSALVASGALDFEEAVALVAKRGAYMEEAAPAGSGKMVAVLNTPVEVIEEACETASKVGVVTPANYNTPSQIVIGGEVAAVDRAVELLQEAGAKRLIPLNVSGPFHTPLMEAAKVRFAPEMEAAELHESKCPVLSNTLGTPHEGVPSKDVLCDQITNAVKWKQNVEWMLQDGVDVFIEVGPGKTLTQMVKQIAKAKGASVQLFQTDSLKAMTETIEKVKELKG